MWSPGSASSPPIPRATRFGITSRPIDRRIAELRPAASCGRWPGHPTLSRSRCPCHLLILRRYRSCDRRASAHPRVFRKAPRPPCYAGSCPQKAGRKGCRRLCARELRGVGHSGVTQARSSQMGITAGHRHACSNRYRTRTVCACCEAVSPATDSVKAPCGLGGGR
jgi:hypothetical protein